VPAGNCWEGRPGAARGLPDSNGYQVLLRKHMSLLCNHETNQTSLKGRMRMQANTSLTSSQRKSTTAGSNDDQLQLVTHPSSLGCWMRHASFAPQICAFKPQLSALRSGAPQERSLRSSMHSGIETRVQKGGGHACSPHIHQVTQLNCCAVTAPQCGGVHTERNTPCDRASALQRNNLRVVVAVFQHCVQVTWVVPRQPPPLPHAVLAMPFVAWQPPHHMHAPIE
jgi:hypothetical protein